MTKRGTSHRSYSAVPARPAGVNKRAIEQKRRSGRQKWAVLAIAVVSLVFAASYVPAGETVHTFTEISDYNPARESGCTNSGEGCHGSETSYQNFHDYHPDTACTVCHEYEGVGCIPCHGPSQHECAACHDGSMEGASDCVRLSDPFPSGHYRETTHTAMGTDMDRAVRIAAYGEASTTCADCHSRDLQSAHTGVPVVDDSDYGEDVGCYECHNDERSNGLEQVLSDWEDRSCEVCHAEESSAPMHDAEIAPSVEASGSAGCSDSGDGCHGDGDVHGLHVAAPETCSGSAEGDDAGCHDLEVESHKPQARSCGEARECHSATGAFIPDTSMHGEVGGTDTEHHVAGGAQASAVYTDAASGVSTACSACHSMVLGVDHARPNATLGGDSPCDGCHNDSATTVDVVKTSWEERESASACAACHGEPGVAASHGGIGSAHFALEYSRFGTVEAGSCVKSGCHPTIDVRVLHADIGCAFAGCHSATGDIRGSGILSCGGTDSTEGTCHTSSERHSEADLVHDGIEFGRTGEPQPGSCAKAGCHPTIDVRELHETDHCYTSGCHTEAGMTTKSCGGTDATEGTCHTSSERHTDADLVHDGIEYGRTGEPQPGSCAKAGCHSTIDVRELHETDHCYTSGCHTDGGMTTKSCGGTDSTEGTCHTSSERHTEADFVHDGIEYGRSDEPQPGSCAKPGCHSTIDVRELHETDHCYTSGCHTEAGMTTKSCGGSDAVEGTCHTSSERHFEADLVHDGIEYNRYGEPEEGSCAKPGCHSTVDVRSLHSTDHCYTSGCHTEGGMTTKSCGGTDSTEGTCHTSSERHLEADLVHDGIEYNRYGEPEEGSCAKPGCHSTVDVRSLHSTDHCYTSGCHTEGGMTTKSCGGTDTTEGTCHTSSERHLEADLVHDGIELNALGEPEPGACQGAGCHSTIDVRELHSTAHCYTSGCHTEGGMTTKSCGGASGTEGACHTPPPPVTCDPAFPVGGPLMAAPSEDTSFSAAFVSVAPLTTVEPLLDETVQIHSSIDETGNMLPADEGEIDR